MRRALTALAQGNYTEHGIGVLQAKCIRWIGEAGSISQAALARRIETDPALTGRALGTLVERGWVKRERSDVDRREYVLSLSPSGKRMQDKVERARHELAAKVIAALDDSDVEDFERVARKLIAAFT
jgi:DNA-binding MarR family transcriptional regulator